MTPKQIADALGGYWRGDSAMVRCILHDDRNPSLQISEGRDVNLLVKCFGGCDSVEILREINRRFGNSEPATNLPRISNAAAPSHLPPSTSDKTAKARRLIDRCRPAAATVAARYLESRGLELPHDTPLLFTSDAFHWPTQSTLPAMVAPIVDIRSNEVQAAHLTFLKSDGSGKAEVEKSRLYLAPKSGGCVKLWPDDDVTMGLAIAEGLETALVGIAAGYPTWACLDAGNMAAFPVLDGIESLTVLADHDEAGLRAAGEVAKRWKRAGKKARIIPPNASGADWNDEVAV